MIPWKRIASAPIPGDGRELQLLQRGDEFAIRAGTRELMASRSHASEQALGTLVAAALRSCAAPRVLLGGLGMGYTLAAVLRGLGPRGSVVVAELVPAVIEWNRGLLAPLAGRPLADLRVRVRAADAAAVIREERGAFDAVVLDVDNGPEALTARANAWLYGPEGLAAAHAALRPGGVLAVWSASADRAFPKRLRAEAFEVEEVRAPGRGGRRARHVVWVARRAAGAGR